MSHVRTSGAEYLASIFGTEKDKVNCSFYFKIGACRHGDKCSRVHNKPTFSQTLLLRNLFRNPKLGVPKLPTCPTTAGEEQGHFDDVFEEIFTEVEDTYGEIEEMNICDNIGEHMIGNVYIKFRRESDAERAEKELNQRWFGGEAIYAELSPVTDFREACCRQYEMGECVRGGFCNFMHLKPISYELRRQLYNRYKRKRKRKKKKKMERKKLSHRKRRRKNSSELTTPASISLSLTSSSDSNSQYSTKNSERYIPKAYQVASNYDSSSSEDFLSDALQSPSLPAAFRVSAWESEEDERDILSGSESGGRNTLDLLSSLSPA